MPYRVKLTANLPEHLKNRVKFAYLRVPCGKSSMWVADPATATEYGDAEQALSVAKLLQLAGNTYVVEECKGTQRRSEERPSRGKATGDSLWD